MIQSTKEVGLLLATFGTERVPGADGYLTKEGVLEYVTREGG